MPEPTKDPTNHKLGRWMWVMAWLCALVLLTLFFDKQLARQFNPNSEPVSYQQGQATEVKLKRNRQGHYVASGLINQQPVVFLLDTHTGVGAHAPGRAPEFTARCSAKGDDR